MAAAFNYALRLARVLLDALDLFDQDHGLVVDERKLLPCALLGIGLLPDALFDLRIQTIELIIIFHNFRLDVFKRLLILVVLVEISHNVKIGLKQRVVLEVLKALMVTHGEEIGQKSRF